MSKKESNPEPETAATKAEERPVHGKFSVHELAAMTGNVENKQFFARIGNASHERRCFSWQHNAAAQLHGWNAYQHNHGKPLELSREDYECALRCASEPDKTGRYRPHAPACGKE